MGAVTTVTHCQRSRGKGFVVIMCHPQCQRIHIALVYLVLSLLTVEVAAYGELVPDDGAVSSNLTDCKPKPNVSAIELCANSTYRRRKVQGCVKVQPSRINQRNVKPFCGVHAGFNGRLFCTGSTLDRYLQQRIPEINDSSILVGVNGMARVTNMQLDYLFVNENGASRHGYTSQNAPVYSKYKCKRRKFYAFFRQKKNTWTQQTSTA